LKFSANLVSFILKLCFTQKKNLNLNICRTKKLLQQVLKFSKFRKKFLYIFLPTNPCNG